MLLTPTLILTLVTERTAFSYRMLTAPLTRVSKLRLEIRAKPDSESASCSTLPTKATSMLMETSQVTKQFNYCRNYLPIQTCWIKILTFSSLLLAVIQKTSNLSLPPLLILMLRVGWRTAECFDRKLLMRLTTVLRQSLQKTRRLPAKTLPLVLRQLF